MEIDDLAIASDIYHHLRNPIPPFKNQISSVPTLYILTILDHDMAQT